MTAPASPEFRMHMVAEEADVDELGHISNLAYLRWVETVARAHSEAVGYTHGEYVEGGAVFVVRRHTLDYFVSAMAGDALTLHTHIAVLKGATCERHTRLVRDADGVVLLTAVTLWAFVKADTGRPTRITPALIEAFAREVSN